MNPRDTDRRSLLRIGGVALVGALAGCTGGGGDGGGGDGGDGGDDGGDGESTPTPEPVEADYTVTVGPGGDLVFDPEELEVEVGSKVAFVWDSDGHTVTIGQIPFESKWRGTNLQTHEAGFVHTHTFEVPGTFNYYCTPHQASGMSGAIVVGGEGGSTPTAEGTPMTTGTPSSTAGGQNETATGNVTGTPTPE
jgi:plastocyanin